MRNDERLRTIYEVMAPYIVRSERNWREYLTFASRFHKQISCWSTHRMRM